MYKPRQARVSFSLSLPAALFLLLTPVWLQAGHHWAITDFEVFLGKPYKYDDTYYRGQLAVGLDPDEPMELCQPDNQRTCDYAVTTLQTYLREVALEMQDIGFADPTANSIDSIITDYNGRKKVRVYLFDFTAGEFGTDLGLFLGPCDKPESLFGEIDLGREFRHVLVLNSRAMFTGGTIGAPGYQNAAHELFHAVQFASRLRSGNNRCKIGKWITEGTADAVGFYMAKKLRNISTREWDKIGRPRAPGFAKPWGMRQYWKTLSSDFPDSTEDYATSSFWRHLAEWDYAKGNGKDHPGSAKTPGQYHYLVDFLDQPYGTKSIRYELRLLDSWMKSWTTMGGGLAPVYAQFAASIADFMDTRIPPIEGLAEAQRVPRWLKFLFEGCEEVVLSPASPNKPARFSIEPVAARCVTVDIQGAVGPVALVIENSDMAKTLQKQIRIGAIGGELVQNADTRTAELPARDAGTDYAMWNFLAMAGERNTFVLSNVAPIAGDTAPVNGEFQFSIPSWGSSMTNTQPSAPSRSAPAGQPKTRKQVIDHQKSLRSNPTTNSISAVMAGADHRPPAQGCTPEMQSKNLCGPQLGISLTLDYGILVGQGPAASAGGMLKQAGALNMPTGNEEAETAAMMQHMQANSRGSVISISIPVVDYGYSGSANNARIEVLGNQGRSYQAIATSPDENGQYLPNGVVNITEYTPHMLRGSFSANLVETADIAKASRENPVLPVSENVRGQFTVSAPWRGNAARPDADADSAFMTGVREDMMDFLLKLPEDMRRSMFTGSRLQRLCELGFEDQQLAGLGIAGSCAGSAAGAAASVQQCDCRCEVFEQMRQIPLCQQQCQVTWDKAQCEAKVEALSQQRDAEAARYAAELATIGLDQDMYDTQVQAFRDAPDHLRAKFWNDLEIIRQTLAEEGAETVQQARANNQPDQDLDAETLRYKAALEAAGMSQAEVHGLVTLFSISDENTRRVLWDAL